MQPIRLGRQLSVVLAVVMAMQAGMGLAFPAMYRDVEWIRATWLGNDSVTLFLAVPLLVTGIARCGSARGLLLWLGLLGYAVYNYAFYLFGAALNAFFPLYVLAFVLALLILILALPGTDASRIVQCVHPSAPLRLIGGSLLFMGVGLAAVWVGLWAAYAFAARPTPVEPEVFKVVAALDLSLMAPALIAGGGLMWRRVPWGVVISGIASIQGALYLLVLSVNSVVGIQRGQASAPGELPIWAPMMLVMIVLAAVLFANLRSPRVLSR